MIRKLFGNPYFQFAILLAGIFYPLFYQLGQCPLKIWDEARLALSASEMNRSGNWLVPTINGAPDMFSTKPPLMIWLQVFSMRIFGVNEFAVRIPSALASFGCCSFIFFLYKKFSTAGWGLFAVAVLITSEGYVTFHSVRSGDYDSLLTLFTTVAYLSFFLYSENRENKFLNIFFFSLLLAVFTKGIAALMFAPGLAVYLLLYKKLALVFKNKKFWTGSLIILVLVAAYYLFRESLNPGYIQASWQNDISGRYLETLEKHREAFLFYFSNLSGGKFKSWIWFLPFSILLSFWDKNNFRKKLTIFSSILIAIFFLIISGAQTKLEWYDVPMYPFLAIIVANLFSLLYDFCYYSKQKTVFITLLFTFTGYLIASHYIRVIHKISYRESRDVYWYYDIENYLRSQINVFPGEVREEKIVIDDYNVHLKFYTDILNDMHRKISYIRRDEIGENDRIICCQPEVMKYIERNFYSEKILDNYRLKIYHIIRPLN